MGILIVKEDFTGKFALPTSINDSIDEYIAEYEELILTELFGKAFFDLFVGNVDPDTLKPVNPDYLKLYYVLLLDHNGRLHSSKGLKSMLLGIIYFYYVRDQRVKVGMNGAVTNVTEVSDQANYSYLYQRYNDAIDSYKAIQQYCLNDNVTYPDFAGQFKDYASSI